MTKVSSTATDGSTEYRSCIVELPVELLYFTGTVELAEARRSGLSEAYGVRRRVPKEVALSVEGCFRELFH